MSAELLEELEESEGQFSMGRRFVMGKWAEGRERVVGTALL